MKEGRAVCYKIYTTISECYCHVCFKMRDDRVEDARKRITAYYYNNFVKSDKGTSYLVADFGSYFLEPGDEWKSLSRLNGMVLLAKAVDGILQYVSPYQMVSVMCLEEAVKKVKRGEYKSKLMPEQLVDEIKYSSDKIFLIGTSVLTVLYLAKLRRIFVHQQGGFSTA